jgi:hypothetical protein
VSGVGRPRSPSVGRGDADRSEDPTGTRVAGDRVVVPAGELTSLRGAGLRLGHVAGAARLIRVGLL